MRRVEKLSFAAASAVKDEMGRTHGRQELLEVRRLGRAEEEEGEGGGQLAPE